MAKFNALAPAKCILFGEHYVVYGAEGIVCGMEPCNEVSFDAKPSKSPSFTLKSALGTLEAFRGADGKFHASCPESLSNYAAVYEKALSLLPALSKKAVSAQVLSCWPMKGVGNSASLAAAVAAGLMRIGGRKKIDPNKVFSYAQAADDVAHGGRASGIDASAVSFGGVVLFRKTFAKNKPSFSAKAIKFRVRKDYAFLLVDTLRAGEQKSSTSELTALFAKSNGAGPVPSEVLSHRRAHIISPYIPLLEGAKKALAAGDMQKVGELMNKCHSYLRSHGVSSPGIEEAVGLSLACGACGAKLSGAGGHGGAVLVLARKEKLGYIRKALSDAAFSSYEFCIAKSGAHAR